MSCLRAKNVQTCEGHTNGLQEMVKSYPIERKCWCIFLFCVQTQHASKGKAQGRRRGSILFLFLFKPSNFWGLRMKPINAVHVTSAHSSLEIKKLDNKNVVCASILQASQALTNHLHCTWGKYGWSQSVAFGHCMTASSVCLLATYICLPIKDTLTNSTAIV